MNGSANEPRILLFGGTFDPIHHGHLISAQSVAEQLHADRVIFMPAAASPFKPGQAISDGNDRLEMCKLGVEGMLGFEVSDWELHRPPPSYTYDTVDHFRQLHPSPARLYWLIGRDSLRWLVNWHRIEELVELVTFVTAARPGTAELVDLKSKLPAEAVARIEAHILPTPLIEISATQIRSRVRSGLPVRYLVPPAVEQYIRQQGLYIR